MDGGPSASAGTRVQSLVQEDPTCLGVTEPLSPGATMTEACAPSAPARQQEKPPQQEACIQLEEGSPRSPQRERACSQLRRPSTTKQQQQILTKTLKSRYINTAEIRDFPGGPVVKNPPSNAEDTGLIPGQGTKVPPAWRQLSPVRHPSSREKPQSATTNTGCN